MSSQYITDFLDAVAADLLARGMPQEEIDSIRASMEPFVPIVLAHALRLSDDRLTSFAEGSGGWVNYCYTGPTGMIIALNYPADEVNPPKRPKSYNVPYSTFFSDEAMAPWRATKDAEHRAQLAAEAAAVKAAEDAEIARKKREADLVTLNALIAIYGIPQEPTPEPPPEPPPAEEPIAEDPPPA